MSSIESLDELLLAKLYSYRSQWRNGRKPPSRADIDHIDIPHLLPHVALTEVVGSSSNPVHRTTVLHAQGRFRAAAAGTA